MVELAATLFVMIVLSTFVTAFVKGMGGWGNAGLAVIFLTVAVGLMCFSASKSPAMVWRTPFSG